MKRTLAAATLLLSLATACREAPEPPRQSAAPPPSATTAEPAVSTAETVTIPKATEPPPDIDVIPATRGQKLRPVDEGKDDASFAAFRERILAAVRKHDAAAVIAASDPAIRTSFGGGGGAKDLQRLLERPEIWSELETILSLGGKFAGEGADRTFWAPYVYSAWPDGQDAFTALAVISDDTALRELAEGSSRVRATLSYDIVERLGQPVAGAKWISVKTADGRTGFVDASTVRSPIAYRAGFVRRGGPWKMNALVAGD